MGIERKLFGFSTLLILIEKWSRRHLFPEDDYMKMVDLRRPKWTLDSKIFEEFGREGLSNAIGRMDQLAQLVKGHKIKRFILAVYPWPTQIFYQDLDSMQVRVWRKWAAEHGVCFLDLFPPFFSSESPLEPIKKYFIKGDVHWNQAGHGLVASRFLEFYNSGDCKALRD